MLIFWLRLEGLVKALTHQQIRELRSVVEQIEMKYDIIAHLPLEISQNILHYLPIHQIFQARRASSKWRHILSLAQTVEPLLREWYPKHDHNLPLEIPKGLSSESITALKAEHVDAYRSGHAFTFALHKWDNFHYDSVPNHLIYADGIMVWVETNGSRMVKSLNLKTGQEGSFLSEARRRIDAIAVSSSMIVAMDSDVCHVWTLKTKDSHYLQLPFGSFLRTTLAVSGESLAVVYYQLEDPPRFKVFTWTLQERTISSFFVDRVSIASHMWSIMLDGKGKTLLLFQRSERHPNFGPMTFYYTRTNLAGDVLVQGAIEIPDLDYCYDLFLGARPREVNG